MFDTGDQVYHGPTDETWTVAYERGDYLAPIGWPMCEARVVDCTLVEAADERTRESVLRLLAESNTSDARVRYARERLAARTAPAPRDET